jgi:hypothetical protein
VELNTISREKTSVVTYSTFLFFFVGLGLFKYNNAYNNAYMQGEGVRRRSTIVEVLGIAR